MRAVAKAAILAIAMIVGALAPGAAQVLAPPPPPITSTATVARGSPITPLGWYAAGGLVCSAVAPMIGTVVLGREMTASEVGRTTLSCFLGPVGWWLGGVLFPVEIVAGNTPPRHPPPRRDARPARGHNISIPPPGETRFVRNEVLVAIAAGVSSQTRDRIARDLQLTPLEIQNFTLIGRTLQRWRIDGNRSVTATLRALARSRIAAVAQPNYLYALQQNAPPAVADPDAAAQYVVTKLHLVEAHRVSNGDDVRVAVIDSMIDTSHPDLAGVIADQYDALGTPGQPHAHGTAMAGAIAAHSKLIGVAPKVRLLAARTFSGDGEIAQGTTFNVLKSLDWAAAKDARIVNMSFAGPADAMLREMLMKAHAHGMVLIAAVGNAGPRAPPLYPAAGANVIGVTATDAGDKLLPLANRGPQVAVAAPGVDILAAAPDGRYQLTSGTSVAAAHVSGVAALLLARKPTLTPDALSQALVRSAHRIPGKPRDVGAGVIDALSAVEFLGR